MRALGKLKKEPGMWLYDAPMPSIGPHDLLIRIRKTAICGTDLHIYAWDEWAQRTIPVPMTTGHEFFGVVEKVGAEVKDYQPGDRVSGEGHLVCGTCRNCRNERRHLCSHTVGIGVNCTGCFADYFAFPASNAIMVPREIPDSTASFLDPLGNAVHTTLSFDLIEKDVLITGAGPIGLMAVAIARHAGARLIVITDVNPYRLALAEKMHPTRAVNAAKENLQDILKELEMEEGFDVGLEMSGNPVACNQMVDTMAHGGKIALLGILPKGAGVDWVKVIFNGLSLKGIYGREMYETWYQTISMLQSGLDVSAVVTHEFSANDFQQAFDVMLDGKAGKVILDWS